MNTGSSDRARREGVSDTVAVKGFAPDLGIPRERCLIEEVVEAFVLVVLGASGDLTERKLMPALYRLFAKNALPKDFVVLGCGRTRRDDAAFRDRISRAIDMSQGPERPLGGRFEEHLHYLPMEDYRAPESFRLLRDRVAGFQRERNSEGRVLYYLALPPHVNEEVIEGLGAAGLAHGEGNAPGWPKIVIEKPFGRDLTSAVALDSLLHRYFAEDQIFRMDHYLAKETVQNVLMLRFANAIFEPVWNRTFIDHIRITAAEAQGIGHRAGYYENAGVIRDMVQNHLMQILALVAMEPPSAFEAEQVRDEKAKVYRAIRPISVERLEENLVLGQYGPGGPGDEEFRGYCREPGVSPDSLTPTFAMLRLFLDSWRWQGVPFVLASGKRLAAGLTEIAIRFKRVPHSMFRNILGEHIAANHLTIGIQPEERITLSFQTKNPGAKLCLRTVTMDFHYLQNYMGPTMDAYERALLDILEGDQMLFWRQDGVELCWGLLTPVLTACEACTNRREQLRIYPAGSWGPAEAKTLDPTWPPALGGEG